MLIADETNQKPKMPGVPEGLSLATDHETAWREFRKSLTPRFAIVWRDIALIHAAIWMAFVGIGVLERTRPILQVLWAVPFVASWIGFWLHSLLNFGHESAHDNLASNRLWSDRLANSLIWPLYGQSAAQYRRVHWQHHLNLGNPDDTEVSYHHCLSPWFLVKTLTGLHLVAAFARHLGVGGKTLAKSDTTSKRSVSESWPVLLSAVLHGSLVAGAMWGECWLAATTWCIAVVIVFPCMTTLRQIAEHRRTDADCTHDFRHEQHGSVNRLFGKGLFARNFGSAGFNQHLLHHWDPRISYTRFDEMEAFLLRTELRPELDAHRTTYGAVVRDLLRSARSG